MTDIWKHGLVGSFARGEHVVMPRRLPNGALVHGVLVVRTRNRSDEGDMELLAEFRSRLFAKRWARERNAKGGAP